MADIGLCIGYKLPLLESTIYLAPCGQNPLPSSFPSKYLSIVLKSIELDGWLTRNEVNRILEIVMDDVDDIIDFEFLEAYWGEPFRTIRGYFYGRIFSLQENHQIDSITSYWIAPCFITLSFTLALLLSKTDLLIAWVDLLTNDQRTFVKNLATMRIGCSWLCALEKYDDLIPLAAKLIASTASKLTNVNIAKMHVVDNKEELLMFSVKRNGLWFPVNKLQAIDLSGGPVVKSPGKISYIDVVFGKDGDVVYSLLDELLNNMPMSVSVFIEMLKDYFNDSKKTGKIYSKLLSHGLIKLVQAHLYITEKGVKWYENYSESKN